MLYFPCQLAISPMTKKAVNTMADETTTTEVAYDLAGNIAKLSDAVRQAITDGNVKAEAGEVKISKDASPTKTEAKQPYVKLLALNARGMAALCSGKLEPQTAKPDEGEDARTDEQKAVGAADYFNYGFDLDVRASVRAKLVSSLEGPEKAIAKAVKGLMDNAGMSEADATAFVKAQRTKAGLAV